MRGKIQRASAGRAIGRRHGICPRSWMHFVSLAGAPCPRLASWLLLLSTLLTPSLAAAADDAELSLGPPEFQAGALQMQFALGGLFDREIRAALESGLPATLALRWQLLEQQTPWGTTLVASGSTWYRVLFDVLENRYDVFDARGRHVANCASVREVDAALSAGPGLHMTLPAPLQAQRLYHVEAEARLEPLAAGEIADLDSWLRGEPEDALENSHSLGLSRYVLNLMKNVVGMGTRTVHARSTSFSGPG